MPTNYDQHARRMASVTAYVADRWGQKTADEVADAISLQDELVGFMPPEQFDRILTYADDHNLPFQEAIAALVLKGLDA